MSSSMQLRDMMQAHPGCHDSAGICRTSTKRRTSLMTGHRRTVLSSQPAAAPCCNRLLQPCVPRLINMVLVRLFLESSSKTPATWLHAAGHVLWQLGSMWLGTHHPGSKTAALHSARAVKAVDHPSSVSLPPPGTVHQCKHMGDGVNLHCGRFLLLWGLAALTKSVRADGVHSESQQTMLLACEGVHMQPASLHSVMATG